MYGQCRELEYCLWCLAYIVYTLYSECPVTCTAPDTYKGKEVVQASKIFSQQKVSEKPMPHLCTGMHTDRHAYRQPYKDMLSDGNTLKVIHLINYNKIRAIILMIN